MSQSILREQTCQMLEDPLLGSQDVVTKVRLLVEAEYMRRLGAYRHTDRTLSQKYGMTFLEFIDRHVAQKHGYAWEVENDAMSWETAVGGMQTMERTLREVRAMHA